MANSALALLKAALLKRGSRQEVSPQAEELCKMVDHFNAQHWHDRDRYHERIRALEGMMTRLEGKGQDE